MATWLAILGPLALKLIEWWLNNSANKAAAYKSFLDFVEKMQPTAPAELNQKYEAQKDRVRKLIDDLGKPK